MEVSVTDYNLEYDYSTHGTNNNENKVEVVVIPFCLDTFLPQN